MKKTLLALAVVAVLTGCATGSAIKEQVTGERFDAPVIENSDFFAKKENLIAPPAGGPIPVAVYSFRDQTGQRKSQVNVASLSSAVTQGGDSYLIKALQDVGDQRWFLVLERVGLENLIKERQMIRQMREQYQGKDNAKPLPPMLFAGIIMEGAIVGYDSNTRTGGSGVRLFGIGATTQYQSDTVTITLRTVSVSSGEVLTTTTVTKTVLSYMDKFGVLKFASDGEKAIEAEVGASANESINRATNLAIQAAVLNTIREGARKGHWAFRKETASAPVLPIAIPAAEVVKIIKEEKKDELVQTPSPKESAPTPTPTPTPVQPSVGADNGRNQAESKIAEVKPKVEVAAPAVTKQASGKVNVRKTEVAGSTILAVLDVGDEVTVLKEQEKLFLIQTKNGIKGWVLKELVK
jgi:curli production assembly/transport component CsgG